MKRLYILALIFVATITLSAFAADPAVTVHWYEITMTTGNSSQTFTGSSSLDTAQLSARLTGNEAIPLENLRYFGQKPGSQNTWPVWQPSEKLKVFLLPRTVLYFYEFSAEPRLAE